MRAFALFLLITLLVPRLTDDTSVHVAVCLNASQQHAHHAQMQQQADLAQAGLVQTNQAPQDCRHCGDCGVHIGAALTPVLLSLALPSPTAPPIPHDVIHAVARPSVLSRPPLS